MRRKITTQAPGRINIIGEHTDYNDGFVLPAAIDRAITQEMSLNSDKFLCNLTAVQFGETFQFDLRGFRVQPSGWQNYLLGIVSEVQKLTGKLTGFDCRFEGNIPIGGGVSSSSALQVSFLYALNELFDLGFGKLQMVEICRKADHDFIGMRGGIMDQFASLYGKKGHAILLDCRSLEYEYIPLYSEEYQFLLLNSNVAHSLVTSEYNTRRLECETSTDIIQKEYPQIRSLRDMPLSTLESLKHKLSAVLYKRCKHVITENSRVELAAEALKKGTMSILGSLMYASHSSLSNDYEVSCPEIDFLVKLTRGKSYVLGSRIMGGGFGGCTISIIEKKRIGEFIDFSAKAYHEKFGRELTSLEIQPERGAGEVLK